MPSDITSCNSCSSLEKCFPRHLENFGPRMKSFKNNNNPIALDTNDYTRSASIIEEVLPNLFRIEIPLPKNPLKAVNSYVIKSSERNLIIDTGFNQEECESAMQTGLRKLEIDLRKTDFFITHLHDDHIGLVPKLATDNSKI